MANYLDLVDHDETEFAISLQSLCYELSMLFSLVLQMLSAPAIRAPVERLFCTCSSKIRLPSRTGYTFGFSIAKSNYRFLKNKKFQYSTRFFLYAFNI